MHRRFGGLALRQALRPVVKQPRAVVWRHQSTGLPVAIGDLLRDDRLSSAVALSPAADGSATALTSAAAEIVPLPSLVEAAQQAAVDVPGAAEALKPLGWWPSDLAMQGIEYVHLATDMPYWATIVSITFGVRLVLLPLALKTMRNTGRMAGAKPELEIVQERMKMEQEQGTITREKQMMYSNQMKAVFAKHDCNPFMSMAFPLAQLPIFVSFFFALKGMGDYYPAIAEGGTLWFPDLSAADATYIFPVVTAGTFLAMVEIGADGMQHSDQQAMMKNVMRGMAVCMLPFTYAMPCGVFCYWSTANAFSLSQTLVLKVPGVREALDVPLPPPPPPTNNSTSLPKGLDMTKNPIKSIMAKARGEELQKQPFAAIRRPTPPPGAVADAGAAALEFDEKKHVELNVHAARPKKAGGKEKKK